MMVNEMTDDKLEISDIMQGEYEGKSWARNNNMYKMGIRGREIYYFVQAELVDEN